MLYIPDSDVVVFQCYPSVTNLDDLTRLDSNILIQYVLAFFSFNLVSENNKSMNFKKLTWWFADGKLR